jgi:ABC transporter substrate binding protein
VTVYVNRYQEPAFFGASEVNDDIQRYSRKFGESPRITRMPHRAGLPNGILASWGKVELEPLDNDSIKALAKGRRPTTKGYFIDFIGNFARSAKEGLPVYRLNGGAGFVWVASYGRKGRGILRLLAVDASAISPQFVATQAPTNPTDQRPPSAPLDLRFLMRGLRTADYFIKLAEETFLATFNGVTATAAALQQATRTVPIVFTIVIDPVGAGFVASLAKPGGNATGFMAYEYSMSGKWLELLKEIAPRVTRAAVLRDPAVASGIGQFGAVQIVAPSFGVELIPVDVRDAGEIERAVAAFAPGSNGGLIVTASALGTTHRELITTVVGQHKLPAVYPSRPYVTAGGLISYGPDLLDQFRRAAGYVDRILKGEKPAHVERYSEDVRP